MQKYLPNRKKEKGRNETMAVFLLSGFSVSPVKISHLSPVRFQISLIRKTTRFIGKESEEGKRKEGNYGHIPVVRFQCLTCQNQSPVSPPTCQIAKPINQKDNQIYPHRNGRGKKEGRKEARIGKTVQNRVCSAVLCSATSAGYENWRWENYRRKALPISRKGRKEIIHPL